MKFRFAKLCCVQREREREIRLPLNRIIIDNKSLSCVDIWAENIKRSKPIYSSVAIESVVLFASVKTIFSYPVAASVCPSVSPPWFSCVLSNTLPISFKLNIYAEFGQRRTFTDFELLRSGVKVSLSNFHPLHIYLDCGRWKNPFDFRVNKVRCQDQSGLGHLLEVFS